MARGTWEPGWKERIYAAVKASGFSSVEEYALANPTRTFLELAQALGANIAPVQIEDLHHIEALEAGRYPSFVRSSFVRAIRRHAPNGWGRTDQSKRTHAFAAWGRIIRENDASRVKKAWEAMSAEEVPEDWLPDGPDDPIVVRVTRVIAE